jgi:integrator complex subunit 1
MPLLARTKEGTEPSDVVDALRELDELSKRRVEIIGYFDDIKRLMLANNRECRDSAHIFCMRLLRHSPSHAGQFKDAMLRCLESSNVTVVNSALSNLAEYILLAQEFGVELLQKAFIVGIVTKVDTAKYITEALQMLNMDTV